MGINEKIKDKIDEVKFKADSVITSVTNKAFDMNLLKAIKKDFETIIEQENEIIKSQVFLFQILKILCEQNKISIPQYIKNHFRI